MTSVRCEPEQVKLFHERLHAGFRAATTCPCGQHAQGEVELSGRRLECKPSKKMPEKKGAEEAP